MKFSVVSGLEGNEITGGNNFTSRPRSNTDSNNSEIHYKRSTAGHSKKEYQNEHVCFINYAQRYCIGFVDIIGSTEVASRIKDPKKLRKYYSLFLNAMASIISNHHGKVVKNGGDNLFFYFPKTNHQYNELSFHQALECGLAMVDSKTLLDDELSKENLSSLEYRVSMDYGDVEIAMSEDSKNIDLFGSVINNCAKMNSLLLHTGIIIGENLYEIVSRACFVKYYKLNQIHRPDSSRSNFRNTYSITRNNNEIKSVDETTTTIYQTRWNEQKRNGENQGHLPEKIIHNRMFRIMLIDDDEDILYTFETVLTLEGFNVKTFSKPLEAFEHFTAVEPDSYDLLILDIRMPDISGIKLYYRLKAVNPGIPILFITALDVVEELLDALPGINTEEIIKKPIERETLLKKIKTLLG
ncbi:MAG: response regulator [Thermoproteota archaeon]|nr:response regulator [Thermoproteota archaeon]